MPAAARHVSLFTGMGIFLSLFLLQGMAAARTVSYGGQFSAEQAERLACTSAWMDGLVQASTELQNWPALRLADWDGFQRQVLAALLCLVDVEVSRKKNEEGQEGTVDASFRVRTPDAAALSSGMKDVDGLERQAEVLAAVSRLVPEALELAEKGHLLRTHSSAGNADLEEGIPPDELVSERLDWLLAQLEAYALYQGWLERENAAQETGTDAEPDDGDTVLFRALSLAPQAWPVRLARAELLLRQDRYRTALQTVLDLPRPSCADGEYEDTMRAVDVHLYVRGLHLRALAQLRSGQPALAEKDLDEALRLEPSRPELWLTRGAVRQIREEFEAMCGDYYQACALGQCFGLAAARERGQCLPGQTE